MSWEPDEIEAEWRRKARRREDCGQFLVFLAGISAVAVFFALRWWWFDNFWCIFRRCTSDGAVVW